MGKTSLRQLKGIIFDPDEKARTRLKTATIPIAQFDTMVGCGTERETLRWIDRESRVDIIFVSERVDPDTIDSFISKVKDSSKGLECIFVVVKHSSDGGIPVSEALARGADGILCEPFSVEGLAEVVELARRLAREREGTRAKIAATLLVTDIINQLDAAAYLLARGSKPQVLLQSLENLGERLREIPAEYMDGYFEILFRLVSATKPMDREMATKIYQGASNRVRRNTEIKLWQEIASFRPKDS